MREEVAEIGPTPPAKWRYCDGQQLGKLLYAGLLWLEKNHPKQEDCSGCGLWVGNIPSWQPKRCPACGVSMPQRPGRTGDS